MPLSRRVAKFNRVVLNRIIGMVAPWMPGLGVIYHRGRKSGREYHNPINVFRRRGGYLVALTYGSGADWVKNVLAAGECDLLTRCQLLHLVEPTLFTDEQRSGMPAVIRMVLTMANVTEFLALKSATEPDKRRTQ